MSFCFRQAALNAFKAPFSAASRRPCTKRPKNWRFNSTASDSATTTAASYGVKRQPWMTPMMFLVGAMPFATFALGTWQVSRLKWKIALIDELEEKLSLDPMRLPPRINLDVLPEFVWRKVSVSGYFDHSKTIVLKPRVYDGNHGVHVVTPLVRDNGSTVLVDRGFVTNEAADNGQIEKPTGHVELVGMIRTSQPRNAFTPDNEPEKGIWYWTDVDAIAEYAGGAAANVQPVFIEQIFEGHVGEAHTKLHSGSPLGRPPSVDIRNAHLSYIITWYALSAFTAAMFAGVIRNRRRFVGKRLPR